MKIGIVGGGQLARMLALAGSPLGLEFVFVDPSPDACAGPLGELLVAPYDDPTALSELAGKVDLATFDFENVPASAMRRLQSEVPLFPSPDALLTAQDRLVEKQFFQEMEIPTPAFLPVSSLAELEVAASRLGYPSVLKTRRMGYDGKGQVVLRSPQQVESAFAAVGEHELILEEFVPFKRELSQIAVRGRDGEIRCYPLAENRHHNGVLATSIAPAEDHGASRQSVQHVERVLNHFSYVGIVALEFFDLDGRLLVNEMAPRVHNSGHWTIDGAVTSQFENHLRALLGWSLGETSPTASSMMFNWIGSMPEPATLLDLSGLHWHDYSKSPREGRKVGHATLCAENRSLLQSKKQLLIDRLGERAGFFQ